MDDKALFENIRKGSEASFEVLFKSLYAPLCGYAQKYLREGSDSEEIVQEVFCNFWEKKESIDVSTSLSAYLYTSVRNRCLNEIRRLKKFATEKEGEEGVVTDHKVEELELDQQIEEAIAKLPEMSRRVFELSRFDGKKYQEIAEELNIGVKAVEANMSRALKKLREELKEFLISLIMFFMT